MNADAASRRIERAASWLCAAGALIAVLTLAGEALRPGFPASQWMSPETGACLLLAAFGVALRRPEHGGRARRLCSAAMGALILAHGGLVASLAVTELEGYIARHDEGVLTAVLWLGRSSPFTEPALAALGAALLLFDAGAKRSSTPREWLCLAASFVAFASLVGHAFGAEPLQRFVGANTRAVPLATSLALSAISLAGLLARPRVGLMRLVSSPGPGGVLLRRLGLIAILLGPSLGGSVLLLIDSIELADVSMIMALGNVTVVFLALALLAATALPLERAYGAVEASRARAKDLFDQAPEGIFIADLEGRYIDVNRTGCRMLGFTREELLVKTLVDSIPSEDVERLWQSQRRMLQGSVETGPWSLRRKDGSYVPVEVTAKILSDGRWQVLARDITDRLELERKLLESRDFLHEVLESSTEYGIIATDLDRRVILWNRGARLSYGYEPGEIRDQPIDLLVTPAEVANLNRLHARAIKHGSSEGSLLSRRKDGTIFSAQVVCTRRFESTHRTTGVLLVVRDLTSEQRRLAEQEFLSRVGVELATCLESRETVTRVAELATGFLGDIVSIDVVTVDADAMRREHVRHRSDEQTQVARDVRAVGPAFSPEHPLAAVLATRRSQLLPHITPDQLRRFASSPEHARVLEEVGATSAMLVPLIARGQLLAVLAIASCRGSRTYGPADLRLAEEVARRAALSLDNVQLFAQSRLLGAMTAHLTEGVILVRAEDGTIAYANHSFEAMSGYAPEELIGKPVHILNAPDDLAPKDRSKQIMEQLERAGTWHGEIECVRKNGTRFWCSIGISTYHHENYGKVWISVNSDVTDRKQLEQRNARALREKEVLLQEIHHRVKNNLQVISSLFSLQRQHSASDELKALLDECQMRVQSIALVHEQLYLSPEIAAIDLDAYLRALVREIRSSYGAYGLAIEASAHGIMLDVQQAVPCALLTCELVSNSIKHAFEDGPGAVCVLARREDDGSCLLEVRDNGRGMPPDFDWKTASSLGLRLVQALARQLRGTIELDRSAGTTFKLRFALLPAAESRALPRMSQHLPSN